MECTGTVHGQPAQQNLVGRRLGFSLLFLFAVRTGSFSSSALRSPQSCLTRSLPDERLPFSTRLDGNNALFSGGWGDGGERVG